MAPPLSLHVKSPSTNSRQNDASCVPGVAIDPAPSVGQSDVVYVFLVPVDVAALKSSVSHVKLDSEKVWHVDGGYAPNSAPVP